MLGLKRQLQGTMICVLLSATITHNTHILRTGRQKLETRLLTCSTFHNGHVLRTLGMLATCTTGTLRRMAYMV
jgi:hypothetical protein